QIEALRQHSDELAADLIRIYRLPPGAAPQLEALAQEAPVNSSPSEPPAA
ncbi:MAG: hypothetical protein HGB05_15130, partial [Chloroflexi bacterium]|nr:hypothetical protein [Chloroflexota bacterium]